MYYVGLDLHKNNITGWCWDSQGAVVATERRLPPVLETMLGWLAPLGQPVAVALEATLYWTWLHARLTAAGYQVAVAQPQQVKLICHARCKTDPVDARKLADLLRTDLLPAIWIPDAETRARRTLLRGRAWVVRTRTRVKARIQAYLAAENERVPVSDLFSRGGRAWLVTVALPPAVRRQVDRLLGPVRQNYERLLRAKGKQKATVAAARKLCCYVYWMMKEGRSYDDWLRQRQQREVRPIQAVASVA